MTKTLGPLVIVDMQEDFIRGMCSRDKQELVSSVVECVHKARSKGRFVVLLEYQYSGPTIKFIKDALKGYTKKRRTVKKYNDGSKELSRLFSRLPSKPKSLTVCGVHLSYCVLETVSGMIIRGYKCRIIQEATANTYDSKFERLGDFYDYDYFRTNLIQNALYDLRRLKKIYEPEWVETKRSEMNQLLCIINKQHKPLD